MQKNHTQILKGCGDGGEQVGRRYDFLCPQRVFSLVDKSHVEIKCLKKKIRQYNITNYSRAVLFKVHLLGSEDAMKTKLPS